MWYIIIKRANLCSFLATSDEYYSTNSPGLLFFLDSLMPKHEALPEKYCKAIALIEQGKLTYRDIAQKCGISVSNFYDLIEGNYKKQGTLQQKFTEKLEEVNKRRDKEIRNLSKNCRKKTLYLIDDYLTKHNGVGKNDTSLVSSLTSIANCLAKVTPNVEIGSFTFQKGLSPEDIYAEFKRLTGIASDRGAVHGAPAGGTGEIPVAPRPRVAAAEESEDTVLPTEPEA